MTSRARYRPPPIAPRDRKAWTAAAACRPDHDWTTATKPGIRELVVLRGICESCPVQADCADTALTTVDVHPGVYAGIFLPSRRSHIAWMRARELLFEKTHPITEGTA